MAQQAYAPFLRGLFERLPALRPVAWLFEAGVLALFWGLCGLLPPDRASALGRALLRAIGPRLRKHRHVRRNLAIALPGRSAPEIDATAREVWGGLGAVLGEFPHLPRLARERVEIVMRGEVRALREPGTPAVLVTAHLANWELSTLAIVALGLPLTVLYAPDANPWIERLVARHRRRLAFEALPRDGGSRALIGALKRGRCVGLIVDTRIDEGELVPFFGVPTPTTTVPARLALRHGCELVPVRIERLEGARFRVTIHEPIRDEHPDDDPRERARRMTEAVHRHFETWIRERPEQWLCTKRRFPEGTPVPPSGTARVDAGAAVQ